MKTTLIATFHDREPARALADRFKQAGIKSHLADDTRLQRWVFWTKPTATRKVHVEAEKFDRAQGLLKEWDKDFGVLKEAIRCPECNSVRVEFPQYTRKFITPLLIELLISLGFGEKDYYCRDCHFTWPQQVKPEPELDELGFPKRRGKPRSSGKGG